MSATGQIASWVSLLVLVLASGCTSTYSEKNVTNEPPPILRSNSRIYIAIPFDASFKKTVAQGSGKQTAEELHVVFLRYTKAVFLSRFPESLAEALESARKASAEYLVYPEIIRWEDRATEWSGRRDQLQLKIDLIDLSTSRAVFSREITATGKWMSDGGDSPRDLLGEPLQQYVNALFRRIEKPSALW
jgi:hypothetical protein